MSTDQKWILKEAIWISPCRLLVFLVEKSKPCFFCYLFFEFWGFALWVPSVYRFLGTLFWFWSILKAFWGQLNTDFFFVRHFTFFWWDYKLSKCPSVTCMPSLSQFRMICSMFWRHGRVDRRMPIINNTQPEKYHT